MFLITSCGENWESVKRGLTGQKKLSTDEFLVRKKDPLVLPPDFDSLPTPTDRQDAIEEISSFKKKMTKKSLTENTSETASSTEETILKKIPKISTTQNTTSSTAGSAEQSILQKIKKK